MLRVVSSLGTSLLAKGGKIFLILIPQYVGTFLRGVIIITQNSKIIPYPRFRYKIRIPTRKVGAKSEPILGGISLWADSQNYGVRWLLVNCPILTPFI